MRYNNTIQMTIFKHISIIFTLLTMALTSVSCTEEPVNTDPPIEIERPKDPVEQRVPTYTIIYYASGGGAADAEAGRGLDLAIEKSIEYFQKRQLKRNVKFTACVKWSKDYVGKYSNGEGNTYRFYVDKEHSEFDFEYVGDNSYAINEPQNIADFITWSKEVAPSEEYIVVFSGHGNGWHPEVGINDAIDHTRGILRDTDTGRYVSCEELQAALEIADTHFRMIFLGSCLMNTIEYVTALSPFADYILASSHISIMFTTELNYLAHMLEREITDTSDETFITAIHDYLYQDINTTISNTDYVYDKIDFMLTDCRKVDPIIEATKAFTDNIIRLYDESDAIGDDAFKNKYGATITEMETYLAKSYFFLGQFMLSSEIYDTEYLRQSFTYDIGDIASRAAEMINDDKLKSSAEAVHNTSREAQAVCYATTMVNKSKLHHSVTFTNATKWEERNYEDSGYEMSLFDQRTGWSRFLKRNNVPLEF